MKHDETCGCDVCEPPMRLTPYRVLVRKIAAETDLPIVHCAILAERCVMALEDAGHLPPRVIDNLTGKVEARP